MTLSLQCPQPTRLHKRKNDLLEDSNDQRQWEGWSYKKRRCSPISIPKVLHWLEDIGPPCRPRSDSYLLDHQDRRHLSLPDRMSKSSQSSRQPLTPLSLPPSQVPVTRQSVSAGEEDSRRDQRVYSSGYRNILRLHGVHIDPFGRTIPEPVQSFAQEVISRTRTSPRLSDENVMAIQGELADLTDVDEGTIQHGLIGTGLFPTNTGNPGVATGGNSLFDGTALPYTSGLYLPPISTPKPDLVYGYPFKSFTAAEAALMWQPQLSPYAQPTTANYWPFFVVEFKSGSQGGTRWVAENQNAGTGAHCVNSIETLLGYLTNTDQPRPRPRTIIDSLAFSCVAESDMASLWVHWRTDGGEDDPHRTDDGRDGSRRTDGDGGDDPRRTDDGGDDSRRTDDREHDPHRPDDGEDDPHRTDGGGDEPPRFTSSKIESFSFQKAEDVRAFRGGVRNIIDYALAERLDRVKDALKQLSPLLHRWDQEAKAAKTRRPSQGTEETSNKR
ncbi:MAG: hypothetical protein M1823_001654 [Watsoniomyces obsoletus]|nr:MAG: hypothetical protein M1823_001654 [Watsoniomyces obsoletus]